MQMPHHNMPSMALVSLDQVTHTPIRSGNWSDATIWGAGGPPGAGARVHIPAGIDVTVDTILADEFKTVRVDGTLSFATDVNTQLKVDTLVSTMTGHLVMGTQENPIQTGVTASIEFADDGVINQTWDPSLVSRGALLHGKTTIHGAEKTGFIGVDGGFAAGTSAVTLATLPTGWAVGDELVIAGTDPSDPASDETVTIREITTGPSGVTIAFSTPLVRDHLAPRADLDVHIANMTRNVTFTSENEGALNRGHVMFMHTNDVDARYVSFQGLGRTDKTLGLNDWRLTSNPEESILPTDAIIEDLGGTNVRGRYSVHFHRGGDEGQAGLVQGAVVRDDPGWAYVNHSSNVDFIGNISHNIVGAAYNTEAGDEVGSFVGNIAIRTVSPTARLNPPDITFDPDQAPGQRVTTQDYGWQGDGFWFHGANVTVEDNVVSGATGRAYIYWGLGLVEEGQGEALVDVADLPNGELTGLPPGTMVRTKHMPVASFDGNSAYSSTKGLNILYLHTDLRDDQDAFLISEGRLQPVAQAYEDQLQSTFSNYTAWNVPLSAIEALYSGRLTFENLDVTGAGAEASVGISLDNFANQNNLTVRNAAIDGYEVGIAAPRQGDSEITGATISAPTDIRIIAPDREARDLEITNVQFAALSDLFPMATEADFVRRNIELDASRDLGFSGGLFGITEELSGEDGLTQIPPMFFQDRITLNIPGYQNTGLFFNAQAPDFVPVPPGSELSRYVPGELVGLTNAELQTLYGFSFSDALLPSGATGDPLVTGGLVGPALPPFPEYPPVPDSYWVDYLATLGVDISPPATPDPIVPPAPDPVQPPAPDPVEPPVPDPVDPPTPDPVEPPNSGPVDPPAPDPVQPPSPDPVDPPAPDPVEPPSPDPVDPPAPDPVEPPSPDPVNPPAPDPVEPPSPDPVDPPAPDPVAPPSPGPVDPPAPDPVEPPSPDPVDPPAPDQVEPPSPDPVDPPVSDPSGPMGTLEIGSVKVRQTGEAEWHQVTFSGPIMDARVVMGPLTHNGGQPAVPRVRNITEDGFEFQIDEWDYLDGGHISETVSWMAMTEGTHVLPSGQVVTAGRIVAENAEQIDVSFGAFSKAPAVFAQVTSANGPEAVTNRVSAVTSDGFSVRLQEEEAGDQVHAVETVDWIAVDYGIFADDGVVMELDTVDHLGESFVFTDASDPAILAAMQTQNGGDTAGLRLDDVTGGSARIFVEEEHSADGERWHVEEEVALLIIDQGSFDLY